MVVGCRWLLDDTSWTQMVAGRRWLLDADGSMMILQGKTKPGPPDGMHMYVHLTLSYLALLTAITALFGNTAQY